MHIRSAHNAPGYTSKADNFGFTVSECPTHGQPAWEDSVRSDKRILFFVGIVFWRLEYPDLLDLAGWHALFHNGLGLVDVASRLNDSSKFMDVTWFMVSCHLADMAHIRVAFKLASTCKSSTVTYIANINVFIDQKDYQSA